MKTIFILLLCIPFSIRAQILLDANGDELKGKVKNLVEFKTNYWYPNLCMKYIPNQVCVYIYDSSLKKETIYLCKQENVINYNYDTFLNPKEYCKYFEDFIYKKDRSDIKITYEFDSNNYLIERTEFTDWGAIVNKYKYDINGNVIEDGFYYEYSKSLPNINKYKYDSTNRLIEISDYFENEIYSISKIEYYTYDSTCVIEKISPNICGSGIEKYQRIIKYTDNKLLNKQLIKNDLGYRHECKFDSKGNWIEKEYYLDKITFNIKRIITYY